MKAMRKGTLEKAQESKLDEKALNIKALEARFNAELDAERKEFYEFIVTKRQTWDSDFLRGMQEKIDKRQPLSDNMKSALRKMQERDRQYEANKAMRESKKDQPIKRMTVLVKKWWIMQNELANYVFTFDVYAETSKAYMVKGHADLVEQTYCTFCGKRLTEVASQLVGCGAICAAKNAVPYPDNVLAMTKKERTELRKQIVKILHKQEISTWIPKSQIKEILSQEDYK